MFVYDHHADHRQRISYRLNLSILIATLLLIAAALVAVYPLVVTPVSSISHGGGLDRWRIPNNEQEVRFTQPQQIAVFFGVFCAGYLALALFVRSRP